MNEINMRYAVESAHDENILTHDVPLDKECYLSFRLSQLTLQSLRDDDDDDDFNSDEDMMRIRQQLLNYKHELDALDRRDANYYAKKELLIYKIFCAFRGIDCELEHDNELEETTQECES